MPWGYGYEGPIETEIKYMKEGDKKSIDVVSENSDSHDDHTRPSFDRVGNNNTDVVVDPDSGESPLVRRGRKSNRPKIAEQKPMPNIDLRLETVRARQEADIILGKKFAVMVRPVVYNVGDYVWRNQKKKCSRIKLKIARHWTGPWVITEKLSDITFKVKCAKNSPEVTVHGDILKPYLGSKKWFGLINKTPVLICPMLARQHPVEFPDLAKFTADVDDESSSVSENLPGILGEKKICPPEIIPVSASDGGNHSDTCPTDLGIPESDTGATTSDPDEIGDSHIDSVEILLSLITHDQAGMEFQREHNFATSTLRPKKF
ncbi:unnamed protein product [Mytilus coruscus]|uniref:Integrase p58-like C-terminal domain-containing protein n=1 Tax=Mytilus coruscus TaxID=42192 RepID=A0A6J8DGX1_MYTCO|nr:unnamed protein product [Mytilus coruscus]